MCAHVTECPDAAPGCAGVLFCPKVEDWECAFVGDRSGEEGNERDDGDECWNIHE